MVKRTASTILGHHSAKPVVVALAMLSIFIQSRGAIAQVSSAKLDSIHRVAPQIEALQAAQPHPGSPEAKLGLLQAAARAAGIILTAKNSAAHQSNIETDIVANVTPAVTTQILALGGKIISQFPLDHAIRAELPPAALIPLAANPDVKAILPAQYPRYDQGLPPPSPFDLEGDVAHKADVARSTFQVDGSGVKVCVISDSVDAPPPLGDTRSAYQIAVDANAIPPLGPTFTILPNQAGQGSGEGLAMLEIVHKIAPGATLGFATAAPSVAQMGQNIRDLVDSSKCKIIVDDASPYGDPPFQDGAVARAINEVTAAGVLYVSSAGNFGNEKSTHSGTWQGLFQDGGTDPRFSNVTVNQFGTNLFAEVTSAYKPQNPKTQVALYWNDDWFNATNAYGLYVFDKNDNLLGRSQPSGLPYTVVDLMQPNSVNRHYLDVGDRIYAVKPPSTQAGFLRLMTFGATIDVGTNSAIWGHAGMSNVITVASARVPATLGPFGLGATVNPESSDGPVRMFFKADGSAFDRTIDKPDFTAASCVSTTFPKAVLPSDAPLPLNPFCGTSAAAPQVAAIAALVWGYAPTLSADQVRDILVRASINIGDAGWDFTSGHGIPMADKAVAIVDTVIKPWDDSYGNVVLNGIIRSMVVQSDRKVLVCGDFTRINGQSRTTLARLNEDGSLDAVFDPKIRGNVSSLALAANDDILIAGNFDQVNGQPRPGIARLNASGLLDSSFAPNIGGYNGNRPTVAALAIQSDQKILIGGLFLQVGSQDHAFLARLNTDGSPDTSFNVGASSQVFALAVQKDQRAVVGGIFDYINGRQRASSIARLKEDGVDQGFQAVASGLVSSLTLQPDGQILVFGFPGRFAINGVMRSVARLRASDGSLDPTMPDADDQVSSVLPLKDGGLVLGGRFAKISSKPRPNLARLNPDGTLDPYFAATAAGDVGALAVQQDGKILVASGSSVKRLKARP